jgi:O-acetylserine/cysteine efflux transporter
VAAWSTLFGFMALLPWTLWEANLTHIHITAQSVAVAAYLGAAVSVAGLFLWLRLLRTVPAPAAASVQYLQPVVGITAASVMFGDKLGVAFDIGVVLIIGGLAQTVTTHRQSEEGVPHE